MNTIDLEFCMHFKMDLDFEPIHLKDSGCIGSLIFKYYYKRLYYEVKMAPPECVPWKRIPRKTKERLNREERQKLNKKEMGILNEWLSKAPLNVERFMNYGKPEFVIALLAKHKRYEEECDMRSWMNLQEKCPALRGINYDGTHNADYASGTPN